MNLGRRHPRKPAARARVERRRGLTAAAEPASAMKGALRRLNQQWQTQALGFYDTCEVCWYPAQSYARIFQRIRFFPAILNDRGEPEEVDSGPLVDLWDRVQDPGGGRTRLLGAYGRLQMVIADGYLTVSETDGEEGWEYLSPLELRQEDSGNDAVANYRRSRAPGLDLEQLVDAPDETFAPITGNKARVWRLWRPHPTYSQWADSSMRPILPLFALLERLTLAANADSLSRAASRGGLYVPDELRFAPADADAIEDDPAEDDFTQELIESLMANIADPGSAAAMAPVIIRGPAVLNTQSGAIPMADCIKPFPLGPDTRYREAEMWEKVIRRIGIGLDLPAEYLTGTGDMNHWGGWLVDEQAFRLHFAPGAQNFCDDITSAYLRPAAREDNMADWDRVTMGFDPAEAINHPNEIETAQEAYDRYVVSAEYYRGKIGATEEDAPADDEIALRLEIERGGQPAQPDPAVQDGETSPADGGTGGDTVEGAPGDGQPDPQPGQETAAVAAARVIGAAEFAVARARELAGNRIRSRIRNCDNCLELIEGAPSGQIAAILGPQTVGEILRGKTAEASLVAGAGDAFADTLNTWGLVNGAAGELGRLIEVHALRTLHEDTAPPLPAGFAAKVARAVAA